MSTRYVWGKYSKAQIYVEKRSSTSSSGFQDTTITTQNYLSANYLKISTGYTFNKTSGAFTLTGSTSSVKLNDNYSSTNDAATYLYAAPYNKGAPTAIWYNSSPASGDFWDIDLVVGQMVYNPSLYLKNGSRAKSFSLIYSELAYEKGNFVENISSASSAAYPNDGESGSYWYTYLGSDNIDPTAVTYSTSDLQAGESITIRVTPRTPTCGGTVYYLYQYSTNGSTWTNIGSRTTNTSVSVTIPAGATQFQARVLASDGWGFTSTTYVTGPSLGVSQLKAYVGVSGKARAVQKIYIGVNGKAREVVKGYVGVGGKARKFL